MVIILMKWPTDWQEKRFNIKQIFRHELAFSKDLFFPKRTVSVAVTKINHQTQN